ncbi:MAG: phosphatidate cytidylyltransferase [Actinomycetes bacterium]
MASDDLSREPRAPGDPEEVRIISADEIAEASSRPDVAARLPERELPPPPPPVMNVGSPDLDMGMLHWTEPATGQIPAIVIGDNSSDDDRASMIDAPRWRSEHDTSDHVDLLSNLGSVEDDELVAQRLGALDTDERITDEAFLNFDDVELSPQPRRRGLRRERAAQVASAEDDVLSALLLPPDLVNPGNAAATLPPPPPPPPSPVTAAAMTAEPVAPEPRRRRKRPEADVGAELSGETVDELSVTASKPRNVPMAAAVGIGMAIVAALLFKAGAAPTMLLIEVVLVAAGFEFFGAMQRSGFRPATLLGLVAVAALPIATYWKGESAIPAIIFLTFLFGVVWYLSSASGRARPTANLGVTLIGVVWIGVLGSYAALLVDIPQQGISLLLVAVVAAVATDVGGFFFGRAMGRSPLIATSPNKTVEGLVGGMAATVFAVFVFVVVLGVSSLGAGKAIVLAIVLAVIAPLGDLAESLFKRDLGLKDMGSLIPEHGGLLDRFDALLFVLPTTYYMVRVLGLG